VLGGSEKSRSDPIADPGRFAFFERRPPRPDAFRRGVSEVVTALGLIGEAIDLGLLVGGERAQVIPSAGISLSLFCLTK